MPAAGNNSLGKVVGLDLFEIFFMLGIDCSEHNKIMYKHVVNWSLFSLFVYIFYIGKLSTRLSFDFLMIA